MSFLRKLASLILDIRAGTPASGGAFARLNGSAAIPILQLMEDERLTFKEMCARFDVTARTLRWYEYIELISPEREGRARYYGPREIARMTLILRGRRFGFSLEEIRQWLQIYEKHGTEAQMREWIRLADRQLAALTEQRSEIERTIDDLQALRDDVADTLR